MNSSNLRNGLSEICMVQAYRVRVRVEACAIREEEKPPPVARGERRELEQTGRWRRRRPRRRAVFSGRILRP